MLLAEETSMSSRNTYRYRLKVGDRVVYYGFTTDLHRREQEHRRRWPSASIERIGEPTSHREAWEWAREVNRASARAS